MSIGIIELNDAGLRVGSCDRPEQVLHESPGVAVLDGNHLLLGEDALAQVRLHPLQSNSLFWQRLSTDPLAVQSASYRHHADLAYSQLLALHKIIPQCEQIIFALPATYTREQLSLLLGIVDQCPFKAIALVDSAVVASASRIRHPLSIHLDIQLQQCVISSMELSDGQLTSKRVEALPGLGSMALWDRWAKVIADQFIDQCRFDPLHSAPSEQSLYDQLPHWIAAYATNDELVMDVSGKSIRLSRAAFIQAVKPLYEKIRQRIQPLVDGSTQLLISDRMATLPAFVDSFDQFKNVDTLPVEAVMQGVHQYAEHIVQHDGALRFNRALPVADPGRAEDALSSQLAEKKSDSAASLHLLIGHTAYPLDGKNVYLNLEQGRQVSDASQANCCAQRQGDGVLLTPLGPSPLRNEQLLYPGDKVGSVSVIEVLHGHGTQ